MLEGASLQLRVHVVGEIMDQCQPARGRRLRGLARSGAGDGHQPRAGAGRQLRTQAEQAHADDESKVGIYPIPARRVAERAVDLDLCASLPP